MKKLILTLLIFTCVLFAGSKAYIALFTYQIIETLKSELQEETAITYSWISSSLDGEVIIHDLVVTPYQLKQTYSAEFLKIGYKNYPSLLFGLLNLKGGSWQGISQFQIENAKTALEGRGFIDWLSLNYDQAFSTPLGIYACGPESSLSPEAWQAMGIKELAANLDINISTENTTTTLTLNADLRELGELSALTQLAANTLPHKIADINLSSFEFLSLDIQHIEKGYFRRLSNYCSRFEDQPRPEFSQNAGRQWAEAMGKIGFITNRAIERMYTDYIELGGKASLNLTPKQPFNVTEASKLLNTHLSKELGLSLHLNGVAIENPSLYLKSDYFRPPIVIESQEPQITAPTVKEKAYVTTEWQELAQYKNRRIKVLLQNEKTIEGILLGVNEHTLDISQRVAAGEFSTHPHRRDITETAIWR